MNKCDFVEIMRQTHAPLEKMLEMVPDEKLSWAPAKGFMSFGQLIKHISENWCITKMMVTNPWPFRSFEEMVEAMKLENFPSCSKRRATLGRGSPQHPRRTGSTARAGGTRGNRRRSAEH